MFKMKNVMKIKGIAKFTFLLVSIFVVSNSKAQCNQPINVMVEDINSISATLNWSASSSAPGIGYSFEVRTSGAPGSGLTGLVDSGTVGDAVFTSPLSGLLSETSYFVYMRFQCTSVPEFSIWTTPVEFITATLSAPVAGTPASLSNTFFTARWIAVPGATGYRLDVSEFIDFSAMLPNYDNLFVSGGLTSKLVSDLNPSTTYYYRLRAEGNSGSGPVVSDNSNTIATTTESDPTFVAVWTENGWLEGIEPNSDYDVFLDFDFISDENNTTMLEVKSLTLNAGYSFTLASENYLIVYENVINNSEPASFVIENNANLYFIDDFAPANEGNITIRRNSSEIFRLDYTMWSSPVTGNQTLKQFSPQTVNNRFYTYDTNTDNFSVVDPLNTTFESGRGFLIRSPNNQVTNNGSNLPQSWLGSFVGVPKNGEVEVALNTSGQAFNLVGNPYPSIISADSFLGENLSNIDGTLYFWRRRNDSSGLGDVGSFYATYTEFGGVGSDSSDNPNGFIQVGQGFLVKALSSEVIFNVAMRVPDNFENQFFRMNNSGDIEKHRIWLNLTSSNGVFSKILVGYAQGASNSFDRLDGSYIDDSDVALTSLINNQPFTIQAKALPFSVNDTFTLGLKVVEAGEYKISLNQIDGLFSEGQLIYLEDKFLSTMHNLSDSEYSFSTEAGEFNNRFVLRFNDELMNIDQPINPNAIAVIVSENTIKINSGNLEMKSINIYDVQGRMVFTQNDINDSEININSLQKSNQVMVLQIKDQYNNTTVKKLIF